MKVRKTDNRFKTGFPKPITSLPKKTDINIPRMNEQMNHKIIYALSAYLDIALSLAISQSTMCLPVMQFG